MEFLKRVKSSPRMGGAPRPSVLSAKSASKISRPSLSDLIPSVRRERESRSSGRWTLCCTPDHSDARPEVIHEDFLNSLLSLTCGVEVRSRRASRVSATAISTCTDASVPFVDDTISESGRMGSVSVTSVRSAPRKQNTPSARDL